MSNPIQISGLSPREAAALKNASPTPADIFKNIDAYNTEIAEQAAVSGVALETAAPSSGIPASSAAPSTPTESENERLDRLLAEQAAAAAAVESAEEPTSKESTKSPEEQRQDQIRGMLHDIPGAPTPVQIEAMKRARGTLHVMALGKGDVYIFSPLLRRQLLNIQMLDQKQSQLEGIGKSSEDYMTEQVIKQCVVWPKLGAEFWHMSKSGVVPTLYSQIMLNSYHLNPQQAMYLTTEL